MVDRQEHGVQITGGQVVAANIGGSGNNGMINAPIVQNSSGFDEATASVLEQLRSELQRVGALMSPSDGPEAQPDEVGEIVELLDGEPAVERAQSKWSRLMQRLPDVMRTVDAVAQVTELFERLNPGDTVS